MTQRERQILKWIEENPLISQQEMCIRDSASARRRALLLSSNSMSFPPFYSPKASLIFLTYRRDT